MRRAKPTAEDIARYAKVRADRKARIEEMAKTVPWAAVAVYRKPMSELPANIREELSKVDFHKRVPRLRTEVHKCGACSRKGNNSGKK